MDPVHGGGPWTGDPCFVLSRVAQENCARKFLRRFRFIKDFTYIYLAGLLMLSDIIIITYRFLTCNGSEVSVAGVVSNDGCISL